MPKGGVTVSRLNRMWPTIALLDSDEFDHRKLRCAQIFEQLSFVGPSEGSVIEMANRVVVQRRALSDHDIVRKRPDLPLERNAIRWSRARFI
jgi:hypothetical protein